MHKFPLTLIFLLSINILFSQTRDSAAAARRDSLLNAKMDKAIYPLIKIAKMGGVIPINDLESIPDPRMKYKLMFNFTQAATSAVKKKVLNSALAEAARIINLHIAAGVPKKNLEIVLVGHASGLFSLIKNEPYQKKFKIDNPNIPLVNELQEAGVTFIVCGQAMNFLDIEKESLLPGIKLAYSAKTTFSNYGMKGFLLMDINE